VRELKEGARPIDQKPDILISPCDAIVGACGAIAGTRVYQAKGFPYALGGLLADEDLVERYRDGCYATLRLTSAMYHRFHAPHDCHVARVIYTSGDTWNVNPIALKRVERLFCKNERAVIPTSLSACGTQITLVAVAAILVAGIRLRCLENPLDLRRRDGNVIACDANFHKGDEMGWFEHGSTILAFAPKGFSMCENVCDGATIRMGQPLMRVQDSV
jgi:phosphatidylserine decarboxylase